MPSVSSLILRYRQVDGRWQSIPVHEGNLLIGRSSRCNLRLAGRRVSRKHAELRRRGNQVWIVDLGSANGTMVNGVRLRGQSPKPLLPGQTFEIGDFSLVLEASGVAQPHHFPTSGRKRAPRHAFISYASLDKDLVYPFAEKLEQSGYDVWIDKQDIRPGRPWRGEIVQAIETADAFILLLSPHSTASVNVRKELDLAIEASVLVLPVILQPVQIPAELKYQLIDLQYVDFFGNPRVGFSQLVNSLQENQEYLAQQPERVYPDFLQAELVLPEERADAFYPEKQQRLINFLAHITSVSPGEVNIASLAAGSVHIIVNMPAAAAYELKAQALNGNPALLDVGISALRLVGDPRFIQIGGQAPPGAGRPQGPTTPPTTPSAGGGLKLFLLMAGAITAIITGIIIMSSPPGPITPYFTRIPSVSDTSTPTFTRESIIPLPSITPTTHSPTPHATTRAPTIIPTTPIITPDTPTITPTEKIVFRCEDAIGCIDIAPGDPIILGYMLDINNYYSSLGDDSLRGIELAIEDRGNSILGHKITLVGEDAGGNPAGGKDAAFSMATNTDLVGIIGTNFSDSAIAASPIISDAGFVMVSPSNTDPTLTDPNGNWRPGYYRTAPVYDPAEQAQMAAEFAYNVLGAPAAATISDSSPESIELTAIFRSAIEEMGGVIVGDVDINEPYDSYYISEIIYGLGYDNPEVLYIPVSYTMFGDIVDEVYRQALSADLLAPDIDLKRKDRSVSTLGINENYNKYAYLTGLHLDNSLYDNFLERWIARYGSPPIEYAAFAYDATNIILRAIERVAIVDADGILHIGRQALRDELTATSGYIGVSGVLSCSTYGDCASPEAIVVYSFEFTPLLNESINVIYP